MVCHMVLANSISRFNLEVQGVGIIAYAVVEAADNKSNVLVSVQHAVVLPHAKHTTTQIIPRFLSAI